MVNKGSLPVRPKPLEMRDHGYRIAMVNEVQGSDHGDFRYQITLLTRSDVNGAGHSIISEGQRASIGTNEHRHCH